MLFLYRPRQTWMPYRVPRQPSQQAAYNRHLQEEFGATRRVTPSAPAPHGGAPPTGAADSPAGQDLTARLKELAQLHADGALSDDEFAAAKARVLEPGSAPA